MINIYLDDLRVCPPHFIVARTVEDAIVLFKNNKVGILSLDHDLGEDENKKLRKTGKQLVTYMAENGMSAESIYIHTDNPLGREDMYKSLLSFQKRGFIPKETEIYHYAWVPNRYEEQKQMNICFFF